MSGHERSARLAWLSAMSALFLVALGNTAVITVLPAIIADIGGFDQYAWASTAYLIAAICAMPVAGKLADLHGRRALLLIGLCIFMAASVPLGLSRTMNQLVLFRALQGLGGGVIMINATSAIADLFPPADRGKYHGFTGLVFSLATVLGPLMGGVVADSFRWWGLVFLINVPLGAAVLPGIARLFPRPSAINVMQAKSGSGGNGQPSKPPAIDYPGIVTLVLATVPTLAVLSVAGVRYAWLSWQVAGLLAFGLTMAVAFLAIESRSPSPIMPLAMYRQRGVPASVGAAALGSFALYGCILFIPLFFQAVQGTSASVSGALVVPIIFGTAIGAIAAGQSISRSSGRARQLAIMCALCLTGGMLMLSTLSAGTSAPMAIAYVMVMGAGVGGLFTLADVVVQNSVPHSEVGASSAASHFQRSTGGAVGMALMGAMMAGRTSDRLAQAVPAHVRERLPEGWDDVADGTELLVDPSASGDLAEALSATGADAAELTREVAGHASAAVGGALSDTFLMGAAVAGASVVLAFFMVAPGVAADSSARPIQGA